MPKDTDLNVFATAYIPQTREQSHTPDDWRSRTGTRKDCAPNIRNINNDDLDVISQKRPSTLSPNAVYNAEDATSGYLVSGN